MANEEKNIKKEETVSKKEIKESNSTEKKEEKVKKDNSKGQKESKKSENTVTPTKSEVKETKKEDSKKIETKNGENSKKDTKFSKPKSKESKKDSKTGYIVTAIILLILIAAVIVISVISQGSSRKTVESMLLTLKNGDFNKVNEYVDYNNLLSTTNLSSDDQNMNSEIQKLLFEKLDWKINKVTEENEKSNIEVEITNKDFKTIISNYMSKTLKAAFSDQALSDEDIDNYLLEELRDESIPLTTQTGTIEVTKIDGKWKVTANDELINILLPGLGSAVDSLNMLSE